MPISDLLKLGQGAVHILGMQKENRFAMGANLGFAIAQNPQAAGLEVIARGNDIINLVADVMNAA